MRGTLYQTHAAETYNPGHSPHDDAKQDANCSYQQHTNFRQYIAAGNRSTAQPAQICINGVAEQITKHDRANIHKYITGDRRSIVLDQVLPFCGV